LSKQSQKHGGENITQLFYYFIHLLIEIYRQAGWQSGLLVLKMQSGGKLVVYIVWNLFGP